MNNPNKTDLSLWNHQTFFGLGREMFTIVLILLYPVLEFFFLEGATKFFINESHDALFKTFMVFCLILQSYSILYGLKA